MKIPITMCHGTDPEDAFTPKKMPLDADRFNRYFAIAHELGFESITYNELAAWRSGEGALPPRPIMFDFDHARKNIYHEIAPVMQSYGYTGNLFIFTEPVEGMYAGGLPPDDERVDLIWEETRSLMEMGWLIGAHTHTHPNLSALSVEDPSGARIREELSICDEILNRELGVVPTDFAFTGTSFSRQAEEEVAKRYRFGRLWIVGSEYEADGGPPKAARYITKDSHPYRLPSMEIQGLIYEFDAFRSYLEGALDG